MQCVAGILLEPVEYPCTINWGIPAFNARAHHADAAVVHDRGTGWQQFGKWLISNVADYVWHWQVGRQHEQESLRNPCYS
jgi:hypothetical protein